MRQLSEGYSLARYLVVVLGRWGRDYRSMRECDVLTDEERCPYALECWDVVSTRPSMCAIATSTTSLPPFVFAPVDMSTTFTTAVVVVIIGHSTDY